VRPVATKVIIGDDDAVNPTLAGGENVLQPDMTAHYKLKCPECGDALVMQEACCKCHSCGWAAC
jgi:predicted RNA-binding Zn-ribbon protein involved in translation (DUF1610 family)